MKLTKEQQNVLKGIILGHESDPDRLGNYEKYSKIFLELEQLDLIKIEFRDNKVYSAVETKKGKELIYPVN